MVMNGRAPVGASLLAFGLDPTRTLTHDTYAGEGTTEPRFLDYLINILLNYRFTKQFYIAAFSACLYVIYNTPQPIIDSIEITAN